MGLTFITDCILFHRQIIIVIFAFFASVVVFFLSLVLFIVSIVFVFGVYIAQKSGFWPFIVSIRALQAILGEIKIEEEALEGFQNIRIVVVVILIIIFITAIVAKKMNKKIKKSRFKEGTKRVGAFSTVAIVFSILGIFVGAVLYFFAGLF
jgi:hypothetical protein